MSGRKDNYVPRKCSATNRLINSKDHASVQISVGQLSEDGVYTGEVTHFALSGFVRKNGEGDQAINRLAAEAGLIKDLQEFPTAE